MVLRIDYSKDYWFKKIIKQKMSDSRIRIFEKLIKLISLEI
jgi:hypothetical protein